MRGGHETELTRAPTKIPSCTDAPMRCAMTPAAIMKRKISTMPPAIALARYIQHSVHLSLADHIPVPALMTCPVQARADERYAWGMQGQPAARTPSNILLGCPD